MDFNDIETQKELDARIEQLQSELTDLKRRRNALSPVSQLPPEILCKILLFVKQEDMDSEDKITVPQYILLCHVSHFWRTTMVGCAEFWADIRFTWSMSRRGWRMLKFMAQHVNNQKISVAYTHDRYRGSWRDPVSEIDPNLVRTLREESSKIKSLSLVMESPDWGDAKAFAKIFGEGEFNSLEVLHLVAPPARYPDDVGWTVLELNNLFEDRPPKLQRLEIVGWRVNLPSSLEQLQGMTHLVFDGGLAGDLFDLLSLSPGLKTLHLANFLQLTNTPRYISQLPHLESFVLSINPGTLLAILKGIQIPPNLAHLSLGWVYREHLPNIREFFDIWKCSQEGIIEPQHVLIGQIWKDESRPCSVHGWKTTVSPDQFEPQRLKRSPPSVTLKLMLGGLSLIDDIFLFTNPQDYQDKWSFVEVRVMEILGYTDEEDPKKFGPGKYTLGTHLWTTIASAPYLQLLHLDSRFEDKFRDTVTTFGQGAFPALQYLIFSFVLCETDRRQISFAEFATSIVEYFKVDRRTPLAVLGFRHCPEKANQDTLDALMEVAVNVVCRKTGEWP